MGRGKRKKMSNDDDDNGFGAWGGYMAAKKSKLLQQYAEAASSEVEKLSNIFRSVSIFVNGYTRPSAEELKSLMALHGGIYHHYHMPVKTTHIIASNLPDTKIKQLGGKEKIVKPEWITDSIKANKLLDFSNYLLYTNQNRLQPKLNFPKISESKHEEEINKHESNIKKVENLQNNSSSASNNETDIQLSPDIFDSYELDQEDNQFSISEKNTISENDKQIITEIKNSDASVSVENKGSEKLGRTLSAKDPRFLSEFYNNSRLHHISTLGAMFKQHICDLREQYSGKFPARENLKTYLKNLNQEKYLELCDDFQNQTSDWLVIMHIDMDCFFVSVGLRSHPELRGKPVAVTHSKGGQEPSARAGVNRQAEIECYKQRMQERLGEKSNMLGPGNMLTRLETVENSSMSEIASCSYEARKAGVKNGMFMGQALKLCPNLKTIPYDFEGYKEVAYTLYNTIAEYTLNIEAVSCDEMFVDISGLLTETGATVEQWATYIRSLISDKTKCPCSTGFGLNRLQARMATKKAKPNGQFYLSKSEDVVKYMSELNVKELPGIGRSISLKLNSMEVRTCGDLQSYTLNQLQSIFGAKFGENLYNHCRGMDEKPLVYQQERKSVSAEVNYGIRFIDKNELNNFLIQLCEEVHSRLDSVKMKGKSVTLKLMVRSKDAPIESSKFMGHGVCDYITKTSALSKATNDLEIIKKEIFQILNKLSIPPSEFRGIGIQISRLEKINSKNSANTILTNFFEKKSENSIQKLDIKEHKDNLNVVQETPRNNFPKIEVPKLEKKSPVPEGNIKCDSKVIKTSNSSVNISKTGKRGRPKGSTSNKSTKRNVNINNAGSLQNFFNTMNTAEKTLNPRSTNTTPTIEVDLEVLNALPEDIRKEIIQQYNLKKTPEKDKNNKSSNTNINSNLKPEVKINVTEIDNNKHSPTLNNELPKHENIETVSKKEEQTGMFLGMNLSEVRQLLREWVGSENIPEPCDIEMLAEYFKNLALTSRIEDLFVMLKFLYNEISKQNKCEWHKAYFKIVKISQKGMIEKNGHSLYVYKKFNCQKNCSMV